MAAFIRTIICKCQAFKRLNVLDSVTFIAPPACYKTINEHSKYRRTGTRENTEQWRNFCQRKRSKIMLVSFIPLVLAAIEESAEKDEVKKKEDETKQREKEAKQKDIDENLITTLKRAKLAESRDQPHKAQQYYDQALEYVIENSQSNIMTETELLQAKVYIHDAMANLAFNQRQFTSAETLFKETLRGLLQQGYSQSDNAVVEISLKLAMIYVVHQKFDVAEHGYRFCLDTQKAKIAELETKQENVDEDTLALLGLVLDSYGKFLFVRAKFADALMHTESALEIAEKLFGEFHPQVAVLYNDKATVLCAMKKYEDARKCVVKAMYIARKTESEDLAVMLCNLGVIDMNRNELKAAREHCMKAQKLAKKTSDNEALKAAKMCLTDIKKMEENQKLG